MKIKKNQKKDLSQYSFIFFQIGLIISLSFSLIMIERKTYKKETIDTDVVYLNLLEKESVPITVIKYIPPPPPQLPVPVSEVFKIVDDDEDIKEANIQSTETDQNESVEVKAFSDTGEILGVGEVGDVVEEIEDIPFSIIETPPVFPGCENLKSKEEQKECMSQKVNTLINKNFNMSLTKDLNLSGIHRIFVSFKIDNTGSIVDVVARAPHPKLQSEGIRVVNMLPRMKPGEQRGRPIGVLYALPITIKIIE